MTDADRAFLKRFVTESWIKGLDGCKSFADTALVHEEDCCFPDDCDCLPSVVVTELATGNKFLIEGDGHISKGH